MKSIKNYNKINIMKAHFQKGWTRTNSNKMNYQYIKININACIIRKQSRFQIQLLRNNPHRNLVNSTDLYILALLNYRKKLRFSKLKSQNKLLRANSRNNHHKHF